MTLRVTIGPATDYLYNLAVQAVDGLLIHGKPVKVSDGATDVVMNRMFVIGLDSPADEGGEVSGSGLMIRTLGLGGQLAEDYIIPGYIDIRVGATRDNGVTQKTVRDFAESVFNPFATRLYADPSLGGVLTGGKAEFVAVTSTPQSVGTAAEPARRQLMTFGVRCTSLINPN